MLDGVREEPAGHTLTEELRTLAKVVARLRGELARTQSATGDLSTVGRATGVLMAAMGLSKQEAAEVLAGRARSGGRSLAEEARLVLDGIQSNEPPQAAPGRSGPNRWSRCSPPSGTAGPHPSLRHLAHSRPPPGRPATPTDWSKSRRRTCPRGSPASPTPSPSMPSRLPACSPTAHRAARPGETPRRRVRPAHHALSASAEVRSGMFHAPEVTFVCRPSSSTGPRNRLSGQRVAHAARQALISAPAAPRTRPRPGALPPRYRRSYPAARSR